MEWYLQIKLWRQKNTLAIGPVRVLKKINQCLCRRVSVNIDTS